MLDSDSATVSQSDVECNARMDGRNVKKGIKSSDVIQQVSESKTLVSTLAQSPPCSHNMTASECHFTGLGAHADSFF